MDAESDIEIQHCTPFDPAIGGIEHMLLLVGKGIEWSI